VDEDTRGSDGASDQARLVLVVDDDEANRLLAVRMLARHGYAARTATDGREALIEVDAGGIDLVLMDCQMPRMDGFEATKELRRRERSSGSRTPVVAMTASVTDLDREAAADAGMDDYVTKPVMMGELAAVLDRWLGDSRSVVPERRLDDRGPEDVDGLERLRRDVGDEPTDRFVATFLAGLQAREAEIAAAVTARSAERVASAAHALKSPSAAVGATALSALCARLEEEARAGRLPPLEVVDELSSRCAEVVASLTRPLES
jgi:two-component system sensor histidine kinase/response regulator